MKPFLCLLILLMITTGAWALEGPVTEGDVFEWWDSGVISSEEAYELLGALETGNQAEVCLLSEAYAQEKCVDEKKEGEKKKWGSLLWKGYTDSTGELIRSQWELEGRFYHFNLRLGSRNLLSYNRGKSEAFLGEISSKELHNAIPLDTLLGAALLYPIRQFEAGLSLDTSLNVRTQLGYKFNPKTSLNAALWWTSRSLLLQTRFPSGVIALWHQQGQEIPLFKIQLLNNSKSEPSAFIPFKLHWNTSAYFHGDSVPYPARLSSSILKNRLWATQSFSITFPKALHTKGTFSARILRPLHQDSLSARFRSSWETGGEKLRGGFTFTCLELENLCNEGDWKISATSSWELSQKSRKLIFNGSGKFHSDDDGLAAPRIELGATYEEARNFAKWSIIFPEGLPSRKIDLKSQAKFRGDHLEVDFSLFFGQTKTQNFHPKKAYFSAKLLF